jgi:hypothetical protein
MSKKGAPVGLGEVCIRLPSIQGKVAYNFFWGEESKKILSKKKILFIACSFTTDIAKLLNKISKKVFVPEENLCLLFLGRILDKNESVPRRCFEKTTNIDSDDDIFLPRCNYYHLLPILNVLPFL